MVAHSVERSIGGGRPCAAMLLVAFTLLSNGWLRRRSCHSRGVRAAAVLRVRFKHGIRAFFYPG